MPFLDVAAVKNTDGKTLTFFIINRHPDEDIALDVDLAGFEPSAVTEHITIANSDLRATNTAKAQNRVAPSKGKGISLRDGALKGKLPPRSYHVIRVKI